MIAYGGGLPPTVDPLERARVMGWHHWDDETEGGDDE